MKVGTHNKTDENRNVKSKQPVKMSFNFNITNGNE